MKYLTVILLLFALLFSTVSCEKSQAQDVKVGPPQPEPTTTQKPEPATTQTLVETITESPIVTAVKESPIPYIPSITFGNGFNAILKNAEWKEETTKFGQTRVVVEGDYDEYKIYESGPNYYVIPKGSKVKVVVEINAQATQLFIHNISFTGYGVTGFNGFNLINGLGNWEKGKTPSAEEYTNKTNEICQKYEITSDTYYGTAGTHDVFIMKTIQEIFAE